MDDPDSNGCEKNGSEQYYSDPSVHEKSVIQNTEMIKKNQCRCGDFDMMYNKKMLDKLTNASSEILIQLPETLIHMIIEYIDNCAICVICSCYLDSFYPGDRCRNCHIASLNLCDVCNRRIFGNGNW
jgi:hypothetical protein